MKNSILYTQKTLQRAGIPIFLITTGSHRACINNLRTAVCFAMAYELDQPQMHIASLLNIKQPSVSKNLKRHYRLYNYDPDYTEIYDTILLSLKKANLIPTEH